MTRYRGRTVPAGLILWCRLPAAAAQPAPVWIVNPCVLDGSVSLATAPEPEPACPTHKIDAHDPHTPKLGGLPVPAGRELPAVPGPE